jgi:UDP-glucose 4-epimerase
LKVIVTGGAGFIGSHIVDALLENGNEVAIIDNLSKGFHHNLNPAATFYPVSITDSVKLKRIFKLEQPDVVIHEAAQTVITRSIRNPIYDARNNILGSLNIVDNCVHFGVKKIIYASTCAVYGIPIYVPVDEDHPLNAISPYGVSKQTVERYLYAYHDMFGLNYCVLRYSNVYGPRQDAAGGEAGVVSIFTHQMRSGLQPKIYGDGSKTRDYIYVKDVVRANLLAMESKETGIYNIGTNVETSDQHIFDLVSHFCSYDNAAVMYVEERQGEIKRICLDNSRACRLLGWKPDTSLEDGIANTVNSYHG